MTTFATSDLARASLIANKFTFTKWDTVKKAAVTATPSFDSALYLADYAKVAAFLCNRTDFIAALDRISALLWDAYLTLPENMNNRFSRALGIVARAKGFDFQNRFQLRTDDQNIAVNPDTAPIGIMLIAGDTQLGYMLRNKLFWKDSMDSRHGEHTHSLQWMVIAEGCVTTASASELYKYTGDYRAPSKSDAKGARSYVLWQWLADCFPSDKKKQAGNEVFLNDENLVSDSFRSPQYIMDYLMMGEPKAKATHFVSTYLFARYKKRGWLTEVATFDANTGTTVKRVTDIQVKDIKPQGPQTGWIASPSSPDARLIRDPCTYVSVSADAKKTIKMRFHGKEGLLYLG